MKYTVASHLNFKIKIKKGGGNIFSIQNFPTKFDLHLWGRALYLEKFPSPKTAEMAENGRFVGPRGQNYNPFFNCFAYQFKIYKEIS